MKRIKRQPHREQLTGTEYAARRSARQAGLWMLVEGAGTSRVWVYFDLTTGKELARYYPASARLLAGKQPAMPCSPVDVASRLKELTMVP
jgi:hypothetical protein